MLSVEDIKYLRNALSGPTSECDEAHHFSPATGDTWRDPLCKHRKLTRGKIEGGVFGKESQIPQNAKQQQKNRHPKDLPQQDSVFRCTQGKEVRHKAKDDLKRAERWQNHARLT